MPGLKTETWGSGDTSWLGSTHGISNARTGTLDVSAFTAPDGYIPSGTPVNAADEGAVTAWTGGAGEQLGFVLFDVPLNGDDNQPAPILRHGIIKTANLPGEFTAPAGGAAGFVFVGA